MILTFYSYKGGVGRSMALANIAQWYYLQGKRVVIADWDLEAPGLEGYFHSDDERLKEIKSKPGIIDMLEEYKLRYSKFKLEVTKAQQEVQSISAKLLDELQQTEIDWEYINEMLNSYALFQKDDLSQIKSEISKVSKKPEMSIADISKILKPKLDGSNLANTISLNINNKIKEDYLDLGSIGIYLSTYSLFKKEDVPAIVSQLQEIVNEKSVNENSLYKILSTYIPAGAATESATVFLGEVTNLQNYLQPMYSSPSYGSDKEGVWLLSAGSRQEFTEYAKKVQNFNWTEFYASYNGESYFEWLRQQLVSFADVILIDSRTGVSEMSGVSTRQLADTIVIITAPNPQNLTGAANMVKSFVNEDVKKARKNRDLKVLIIPSRIDVSESALLNKFQATFYRTVDNILSGVSSKTLWELGIPYIPYYNYMEEKAVGVSDKPEELENTGRSPVLDKAYRSLASFLISGNIETEKIPAERSTQPFIGLRSFEGDDAPLFFGRTVEISRMMDIIGKTNFLIIYGPSGSGKSSVLRAGLIPSLQNSKETLTSSILLFRPGADPFSSLATTIALNANKDDAELKRKTDKLTKLLTAIPNQLKENINDVFTVDKNYILVIDQFEELFTLCPDEQKVEAFINALINWISTQQAKIVLAIRSDYYYRLSSYSSILPKLSDSFFNLGAPSERELRQIITEPAIKAGIKLEQGLPERILKDLETVNNKLPVLQAVMYELWSNRSGNILTHAAYDRLNRVDGVIRQMFEENYKVFSQGELNAARPIITRLVDINSQARRRINLQELPAEKRASLKPFIDKGLLSVEQNESTGIETVELSHDSLISSWPQLREWTIADRDFLIWRQQLMTKLGEWKTASKTNDLVLRNAAASEAKQWLKEREDDLLPEEIEFIKKSVAYRDNQRQTRLGFLIIGVVMIVIIAFVYFNKKTSPDPIGTTTDTTQTKAYEFARKYSAESNPDLDFNLKMLKEYYNLDKAFQDSLKDIRLQIENNISYKFFATIDSFYSSLRKKTFDAYTFFPDTVNEFGTLRNVLPKDIQSRIGAFSSLKITNNALDTTFQFSTDSSGYYYVTYTEDGNSLIDASTQYEKVENRIRAQMDDNFKIKSLIYLDSKKQGTPVKTSPPPAQMRVDLFSCGDNAKEGSISRIMLLLQKQNFNVVRRSFKNPSDPQSPYYVDGNEIRYNGNEERGVATKLKFLLEQNSTLSFTPKEVRTVTPNIISIFICGKQILYLRK
jgi:MinD-like ATPase involved in chromosome partitioning or flagellar assembly